MAGGDLFTLALTADGGVLAWGRNEAGELGDGTTNTSTTPVRVALPAGTTVTQISAGGNFAVALTSSGQVFAWGYDGGQLGIGSSIYQYMSSPVAVHIPVGTVVTQIAAGIAGQHTLALTSTGRVLAWGRNVVGELGDGTTTDRNEPVTVQIPAGLSITQVAAGQYHSLALTSTGQVLAWGEGAPYMPIGRGNNASTPIAIQLPTTTTVSKVAAIAAGALHSLAVTTTGELFAWGDNDHGQLGIGTTSPIFPPVGVLPTMVQIPAGTKIVKVAGGYSHTLAVTSTGELLAWGDNEYGQLGTGTTTDSARPLPVQIADGSTVSAIAAGVWHSLAIYGAIPTAIARNDTYIALRDRVNGVMAPGVLANDALPAGLTPIATVVTRPAHGTLSLAVNGGFTYRPTTGYVGPDAFAYRASAGSLVSNTATVTLSVRNPTSISITVPAGKITYGQAVSVRTTLRKGVTPVKYRTVALQRRTLVHTSSGWIWTAWTTVNSTRTDAFGGAAARIRPPAAARYRWAFAGSPTLAPSTSSARVVTVRTSVRAATSATAIRHNHSVTLTATVRPSHTGQRVTLQAHVGGRWVNRLTIPLKNVAGTSVASTRVTLRAARNYTFRFVKPADADHATGISNMLWIRVT